MEFLSENSRVRSQFNFSNKDARDHLMQDSLGTINKNIFDDPFTPTHYHADNDIMQQSFFPCHPCQIMGIHKECYYDDASLQVPSSFHE